MSPWVASAREGASVTPGGDRGGGGGGTGQTKWVAQHAALFRSQSCDWGTPKALYDSLDAEFHFDFDPCPWGLRSTSDGLLKDWSGKRVFCNPPYGPKIGRWIAKGVDAACAVFLLPSRTDTRWFHDLALHSDEVRFVRGRLKFGDATETAPFPSLLVILVSDEARQRIRAVCSSGLPVLPGLGGAL